MNAWIATVPDGSTIVFRAGTTYRLDDGIKLVNRHHLTFIGNGATLKANGTAGTHTDTPFALWGLDTYITIKGFTIVGNNPTGLYSAATGRALREPHGRDDLRCQARRDRQQHDPQHLG